MSWWLAHTSQLRSPGHTWRKRTAIVRGLLAELTLRTGGPAEEARRWVEGVEDPGGVAGAILLRAKAHLGEPGAAGALAAAAEQLRAPGLTAGLPR